MIHAFTCLLFPLFAGCGPLIDYQATTMDIARNPGYYSGRPVVVTGNVQTLRWLRGSSFGTPAETFDLCDEKCIHVFMREHTAMYDGEQVSVRGIFLINHRIGKLVLRNDIEAGEIFPRV
jgi:hypothetical protein